MSRLASRRLCGDSREPRFVARALAGIRPSLMFFDPPFDARYLAWEVPGSAYTVLCLGRGSRPLAFEAANLSGWGLHEIVFTSRRGRGHWQPFLPFTQHYTVRCWRAPHARKTWDARVLEAEGVRVTRDGRPYSHQLDELARERKQHPHQKDPRLAALAVSMVPRGAWIYDPCAGSDTLWEMCERWGRRYLGIDITGITEAEAESPAETAGSLPRPARSPSPCAARKTA